MIKKSLEELYKIIEILRSEQGCPWDKTQTLQSLDSLFLEECFELSEAIHSQDRIAITEELGDVSFMLLLLSHIAHQDNICNLSEVYRQAKEKLIFRHPHVFGDLTLSSQEEIIANWEALKKQEKTERNSIFEGIPKSLPEMIRFDKLMRKLSNNHQNIQDYKDTNNSPQSELKNLLIQYASEGFSISKMVKEINTEIEQSARQKGL
ncbi:MAG: MazG nucleotide pyrophosphohydrolase domain-containing protein [Brevinema sp.]